MTICVSANELDPQTAERLGAQHPYCHFPPPTVVESLCRGLLKPPGGREGFAHMLDLYGKPLGKSAEKAILAFVAHHLGGGPGGKIHPKLRTTVSKILNKHLLSPCSLPQLPEDHWSPGDTVWRDADSLDVRFWRLYEAGSTRPLTGI